ncbi:RES family NAD+ phosphorylase [Aeromonas hydrophila]|uniref:RES family NAD+ phosphorylase n=1 Tax=Aeromonas hydrophila TaxID=644 RepID=UPI001A910931|nr:RES family NAD+ phosphorylase [Aeromonas hydrophila]MBO0405305.1 RES family NAD+ phosphorylase [Aeromonas hydrophila]
MSSYLHGFTTELFAEQDRIAIESSIGVICSRCNTSAYYFNRKNRDLNATKKCIICTKDTETGILLEDFLFTLRGHISEHYEICDSADSSSVTLNFILKRFTYEHEGVISKLEELLCAEDNSFFKKDGVYRSKVDNEFIQGCIDNATKQWDEFAYELKHERRFSHDKALSFYSNLISSCVQREGEEVIYQALTTIEKNTPLYRARLIKDADHLNMIRDSPEKELSAPPEKWAKNSRMSPPGISFMYAANNYQTAIAELHPYAGDRVAVASFVCEKELKFFDFTLLDSIERHEANILISPLKDKYFQHGYFLERLHTLISKPYRATDTSYIETQMLSEVIRHHNNGFYDGIIFNSTQTENGLNYVIFGERIDNPNDKSKIKTYPFRLKENNGVTYYNIGLIDIEANVFSEI